MTPPTRRAHLLAEERRIILGALVTTRGHRGEAARLLGDPERTLHGRLAALDLAPELAALAIRHAWPGQTARATVASAAARPPR